MKFILEKEEVEAFINAKAEKYRKKMEKQL